MAGATASSVAQLAGSMGARRSSAKRMSSGSGRLSGLRKMRSFVGVLPLEPSLQTSSETVSSPSLSTDSDESVRLLMRRSTLDSPATTICPSVRAVLLPSSASAMERLGSQ